MLDSAQAGWERSSPAVDPLDRLGQTGAVETIPEVTSIGKIMMNMDFSKSRKLISSVRLPAASNQGPVTNVPDTPRMRTFDLIK